MARRPYRLQYGDNPAQWGRTTLPKGSLLSRPPGGPSDAGYGQMGAAYGMAPQNPNPFYGYSSPFMPQGNVTVPPNPTASPFMPQNRYLPSLPMGGPSPFLRAVGDFWKRLGEPLALPPKPGEVNATNIREIGRFDRAPESVQNIRATGRADAYNAPQPTQAGMNVGAGERRDVGGASIWSDVGQVGNLAKMGILPSFINLDTARQGGYDQDLIALGYTNINGILAAPEGIRAQQGAANQGGGGGGENTTIGLKSRFSPGGQYGFRGDKWVTSEKAAQSYWRRRRREYMTAGDTPKEQKDRGPLIAYGVVDFNMSAG